MSGRVNGAGDRIHDLQAARRGGPRPQQPSITPAKVFGMIDRVIASYGIDPRKSTDPQGWRRLSLGSAQLPDIKLRPKQALAIGARLAYANPHGQFRLPHHDGGVAPQGSPC